MKIEDIAHALSMKCRFTGHCSEFYCPTPDQRILTNDLRWVCAGDLRAGDKLIGFDENPITLGSCGHRRRRFQPSTVMFAAPVKRNIVRLVMSDGSEVKSSHEHPWLAASKHSGNQSWITAGKLLEDVNNGRKRYMHRFLTPWSSFTSFDAGWLSGMYDGEGFLSIANRKGIQLGVSQNKGLTLEKIINVLDALGFSRTRSTLTGNTGKVKTVQVNGGWETTLKLLGSVRPMRLLEKFTSALESGNFNKQLHSDGCPKQIVSAYNEGEGFVSGIETSTNTYFCEGYAAHNSVAQHSVLVAQEAKEHKLLALLHDASEAYLPDIAGPIKDKFYADIGEGNEEYLMSFSDLESNIMMVILDKLFGVGYYEKWCDPAVHAEIKRADKVLLATELRDLMQPRDWGSKSEYEPLTEKIVPWSPESAKSMFLYAFEELKNAATN